MFADTFEVTIGDTVVKGRRMSLRELQDNIGELASGNLSIDKSVKIIREHCTLEDDSKFDPLELSPGQIRTLCAEIILPKEGRGISDFIGLLS